ncbi:MAG TPA: Zn-ribbon domain-containing OB-fold protein [Acidimicrobiia bacterium]|nr:Zn-ribbon domain-containing OB-fold protein [Acidimicrobiia bacterium]
MVTTTDQATTPVSFRPGEFEVDPDGSGRILGSRCRACGAHFFPVRKACAGCLGTDLERVRFSTSGTLYTFSVVRQSTPAFEVPYVLGYVDLSEGVRIMSQISQCDPEEVTIGMELELAVEPFGESEDGTPLVGYRFRPAGAESRR